MRKSSLRTKKKVSTLHAAVALPAGASAAEAVKASRETVHASRETPGGSHGHAKNKKDRTKEQTKDVTKDKDNSEDHKHKKINFSAECVAKGGHVDAASFFKVRTNDQEHAFDKFVKETLMMGVDGLFKEFNSELRSWIPKADLFKSDLFRKHMARNRYRDIVCNDLTRVIIKDGKEPDYIHANYVKCPPMHTTFICTQGPMKSTVVDFWRMVTAENVENIVMLAQVVELGKPKCEQYWPAQEKGKLTFGDFTITTSSVTVVDENFTRSTLLVEHNSTKKKIQHFHWKTWPDKSAPKLYTTPVTIVEKVRNSNNPVVVHCSAGIGRTGTFVAVEMSLNTILAGKSFSILKMCRKLREMRMSSIQVDVQYIYIAVVLLHYAKEHRYVTDEDVIRKIKDFTALFEKQLDSRVGPDGKVVGEGPSVEGKGACAAAVGMPPCAGVSGSDCKSHEPANKGHEGHDHAARTPTKEKKELAPISTITAPLASVPNPNIEKDNMSREKTTHKKKDKTLTPMIAVTKSCTTLEMKPSNHELAKRSTIAVSKTPKEQRTPKAGKSLCNAKLEDVNQKIAGPSGSKSNFIDLDHPQTPKTPKKEDGKKKDKTVVSTYTLAPGSL